VRSRVARLASGDTLVLYSDGLIEARRDGSDEMFGFDRFEATLARHVGRGPRGLVAGVLRDLEDFTGQAPREDDMTLLVLRLP
jgi:sigma-B regulation protein RsbU (phosphoserine phosphatase)